MHAQSCPALCEPLTAYRLPWTIDCHASLSMGFPRQEYWSGWTFPTLGHLPDPGIELASPALASRFFTTEPSGSPLMYIQKTLRKTTWRFLSQDSIQASSSGVKGKAWAASLGEQVQDTHRAWAHDAHQPDFLFRDLSWHFTNITGDFPFCR